MESIIALAIGVLTASGLWLLFRPRTFQVVLGLALLSYAVNLFIIASGRLRLDAPPIIGKSGTPDPALFADPLPQALVLTAIVISFADRIAAYVADPALRQAHGAASFARAQQFDWDRINDAVIDRYLALAHAGPSNII